MISKSQLELLNSGLLDSLGEKQVDNPVIDDVLLNIAKVLSKELQDSVTKKKVVGSSDLRQSIDATNVRPEGDGYAVGIEMADHWKYAEFGRKKGKRPPIKPIQEWIAQKGIDLSKIEGKNNLERSFTLAQMIARKIGQSGTIKRFGYRGSGFIKDVLTENNMRIISGHLAEMQGKAIRVYMKNTEKDV